MPKGGGVMLDRICRFILDGDVSEAMGLVAMPLVCTLFYVLLALVLAWIGGVQ